MSNKKHIKFPSIEQFRNVIANIKRQHEFAGLDETGEAIYDRVKPKPILTFTGTIKLHGCFEKNTLVTLANGEEVPISDIKVGDYVLSYDFKNNVIVENEVYDIDSSVSDKKWLKLYFDNDTFIKCTEDHKFFTKNRGWVEAKDLDSNDEYLEYKIS